MSLIRIAAVISDCVNAGRMRHFSLVKMFVASQPPAGSQCSFTENRIISSKPIQNDGMAMATSVEMRMAWSEG